MVPVIPTKPPFYLSVSVRVCWILFYLVTNHKTIKIVNRKKNNEWKISKNSGNAKESGGQDIKGWHKNFTTWFNAHIGREKFLKKTVGMFPVHKFTNKNGTREEDMAIIYTTYWQIQVAISFPVQRVIHDFQVHRPLTKLWIRPLSNTNQS